MKRPVATPLVIVEAGPIGLAAAAQVAARGLHFRVFAAGPVVSANLCDWGHVRLFSPSRMLVEPAVLIGLASLPAAEIIWALRGGNPTRVWGGGAADALPARGALGDSVRALVTSGRVQPVHDFAASLVERDEHGATVVATDGRRIGPVDLIVVATGQRPDLAPLAELALDLDPVLEAPRALASLIDPRLHSCGTVPPHGHAVLAHPEPGFWIAGAKSYGLRHLLRSGKLTAADFDQR